jgi:excisionase family DNA binding protein
MVKGYLTAGEAAERLGVSDARIRRMILDGVIRKTEKAGRSHLIPESEIHRLEGLERGPGRPEKNKGKK